MAFTDLEDVLSNVEKQASKNVNTTYPASIVNYDPVNKKATIKIDLILTDATGREFPFPNIQDVPVQFPCTPRSALTFPLIAGDTGIYAISKHSLDNYVYAKTLPQLVEDIRVHELQDGFFIPGVSPFGNAVTNPAKHTLAHNNNDLVLVHNLGTANESELRVTPAGAVTITGKTSTKMVVGSNQIKLDTSEIRLQFGTSTIVLNSSGVAINGTQVTLN